MCKLVRIAAMIPSTRLRPSPIWAAYTLRFVFATRKCYARREVTILNYESAKNISLAGTYFGQFILLLIISPRELATRFPRGERLARCDPKPKTEAKKAAARQVAGRLYREILTPRPD